MHRPTNKGQAPIAWQHLTRYQPCFISFIKSNQTKRGGEIQKGYREGGGEELKRGEEERIGYYLSSALHSSISDDTMWLYNDMYPKHKT